MAIPQGAKLYINDTLIYQIPSQDEEIVVYVTSGGCDYYSVQIAAGGGDYAGSWTYSGDDTFLGFSTNSADTTPMYKQGDSVNSGVGSLYLYSIAKATTAPPPSFSDVEVTPHDGYITMTINGVDFNLKTAASVSLISFSIEGTTYQAENGMTWAEWCESEYNTGGFMVNGGGIITTGFGGQTYKVAYRKPHLSIVVPVAPSSIIDSSVAYYMEYVTGGGSDN